MHLTIWRLLYDPRLQKHQSKAAGGKNSSGVSGKYDPIRATHGINNLDIHRNSFKIFIFGKLELNNNVNINNSSNKNITEENANSHIFGYAVSLDMTRRDLQSEMKALRRPWEIGKSFERSAPIGEISRVEEVGYIDSGLIELKVNGNVKQTGDLNQMIWKVPEIIAYLSRFYDIEGGDLIMSGTPAGVGPVVKGDQLVASVKELPDLKILVI